MANDKANDKAKGKVGKGGSAKKAAADPADAPPAKMKRKEYEAEMRKLHGELVAVQEWVKRTGAKISSSSRGETRRAREGRSSESPNG